MPRPRSSLDDQISNILEVLEKATDFVLSGEDFLSVVCLVGGSAQTIGVPADLDRSAYRLGGSTYFSSNSGLQHSFDPAPGVTINGSTNTVNIPSAFMAGVIILTRISDNAYILQIGTGNAGGSGGQVDSVVGGTGISVNAADPVNPVVDNDGVLGVIAGANIGVDNTNPQAPVISAAAPGGQVDSVVAGTNVTVDNTDPANPIVSASGGGGSFAGARANRSGTFALPNTANTAILWNAEAFDTNNFHDNITNPERITIPAGVSRVRMTAGLHYASQGGSNNANIATIIRNGSTSDEIAYSVASFNANEFGADQYGHTLDTGIIDVSENDFFEVRCLFQSSSGNGTLNTEGSFFCIEVIE